MLKVVRQNKSYVKNTQTGAVVNTDSSAYTLYMKRTKAKQKLDSTIRNK